MKKTLKILSIIVITMLLTFSMCFATNSSAKTYKKAEATMKLVENNVCNIKFGQYGEFEKKLIECNTSEKTVDISLRVKNNAEKLEDKNANVVLLIDVSNSMSENNVTYQGQSMTRKEAVIKSANTLIDKLLGVNSNIKIGIVEFSTDPQEYDEEGNPVESGTGGYTKPGTDKDARILTSSLTSDKSVIEEAMNTASKDVMGGQTDIEVGLDAAYSLLEGQSNDDTEDYIITLTDGVPNVARGTGIDAAYSDISTVPTKNKLLELEEKNVNLLSTLIAIDNREIGTSLEDPKPTYKDVAERIFGTSSAPTAGSVYYISDEELEDTITNRIYQDIAREDYVLNNIVIKDYFPQNIIDNFKYAKLTEASLGEITAEVNKENNSITWTIPTLEPGEEATFYYRLSLNDTFSSEIVGINLPTNENVNITYDENGTPGEEENDASPIIALDVLPPEPELPQTGIYTGLTIGIIVLSVGIVGIGSYIYIKRNKIK